VLFVLKDALGHLSAHDRAVLSDAEGLNLGETAAPLGAGGSPGTSSRLTTGHSLFDATNASALDRTRGSDDGTRRRKPKQRQSVVLSTTANHQNRMLASRMQAEASGNTRMLAETARAAARAASRAESGGGENGGGSFHHPESALAMSLSVQLHARVWNPQFFNQDDFDEFYTSQVPKKAFEAAYDEATRKKAADARRVKKHREFLTTLMTDLVVECVQDPTVEATLLDLQKKTRGMPIPYFTDIETTADSDVGASDRGLTAFGAEVPAERAAADPWRIDVAQRVVQNTLYNLTEELLHGRFRLDKPPRVKGGARGAARR